MKLTAKYDIEAPSAFVFAQLVDFDGWERAAMRRGADVMRVDKASATGSETGVAAPEPGAAWEARFRYRGKTREVTIRLDSVTPGTALAVTGISRLADGVVKVEVLDLGATRTRMQVWLDVKPKTIAARIYVQSLRLARARVERGFAQRVAQMTVEFEDRYRAAKAAGR